MNNKYKIVVEAPLIRAGLSISTEVSSGYVREAVDEMMKHVRDINEKRPEHCDDEVMNTTGWINVSDRLPTEDEFNTFSILVESNRGVRRLYDSIETDEGELTFWLDDYESLEVNDAVRWLAIPEPEEVK